LTLKEDSMLRKLTTALACAAITAPAWADRSQGSVSAQAWDPANVSATADAQQSGPFGDIVLGPLQAGSGGHPFDPPQTSGAAATLSFTRPGSGDAAYHSFAAAYALAYTPVPYAKAGHTALALSGSLRIVPSDMARLFGLLPDDATVLFESHLLLEGNFIADTSSGGSQASAGVRLTRTLDAQTVGGALELLGQGGADPTLTSSGLLAGAAQARTYNALELALMFPGLNQHWSLGQARGASLLSLSDFNEVVTFTGHCPRVLGQCFLPPDYYETPLLFNIETWGELGLSEGAIAAADMRNTLSFGFTVLDTGGQATDIPVYFTLAAVPEPPVWWLALAGLFTWAVRRRLPQAAQRIRAASLPPA
jgi:hypothetical protein